MKHTVEKRGRGDSVIGAALLFAGALSWFPVIILLVSQPADTGDAGLLAILSVLFMGVSVSVVRRWKKRHPPSS